MQQLGVDYAHKGRALAGLANLEGSGIGPDERLQMFEEGLEIIRNTETLRTPDTAVYQMNFAAFLLREGDRERARREFFDGLANLASAINRDNPRYQQAAARYRELFGEAPPE